MCFHHTFLVCVTNNVALFPSKISKYSLKGTMQLILYIFLLEYTILTTIVGGFLGNSYKDTAMPQTKR
jgi:hypothetical protein